jgi:hypothetical protein
VTEHGSPQGNIGNTVLYQMWQSGEDRDRISYEYSYATEDGREWSTDLYHHTPTPHSLYLLYPTSPCHYIIQSLVTTHIHIAL